MKVIKKLSALLVAGAIMSMSAGFSASATSIADYTDPNGSGTWGISDAIYIMQYLAGAFEPLNMSQLDVDKNGVVSMMDAQSVQLYCIGMWNGEI